MTAPVRVRRIDRGTLAPPERRPDGFLKVAARVARCGIQEYEDGAGKVRRELRPRSEVFDAESMASFAGVPLTNEHPPMLLDAMNARQYSVGSVGEVDRDGDWLAAPLMITDAATIAAAESGRSQVSVGYSCVLDETPGVDSEFGRYDCVQRGVVANHVALVDVARAGPGARIRLDAGDAVQINPKQRRTDMAKVKIGDQEYGPDDTDELQEAVDAMAAQLDAMKEPTACPMHDADDPDAVANCDYCDDDGMMPAAAAAHFSAMQDADELEVEQETENEAGKAFKNDARVFHLAELLSTARQYLGAGWRPDRLDATTIRRAVVAKLTPGAKLDGKSPAYVAARFDAAIEFAASQRLDGGDLARAVSAAHLQGGGSRKPQLHGREKMLVHLDTIHKSSAKSAPVNEQARAEAKQRRTDATAKARAAGVSRDAMIQRLRAAGYKGNAT